MRIRRPNFTAGLVIGFCLCYSFYQIRTWSESQCVIPSDAALSAVTNHNDSTVLPATNANNGNTSSQSFAKRGCYYNKQSPKQHRARRVPNLPDNYWSLGGDNKSNDKEKSNSKRKHIKHSAYPSLNDLKFNNNYWQVLHTSDGTFYLYGAYHDNRKAAGQPSIRVIAMVDRLEIKVETRCLLWYDMDKDPIVVPVVEYEYIYKRTWSYYRPQYLQPYLMACKLPSASVVKALGVPPDMVPVSVSLVEKTREAASNNLRVNNNVPDKRGGFAVCVKGLDFTDELLSVRLIEWIELLAVLGVEKIILYEFELHPTVSSVLHYYEEVGQVEILPISLPGDQPNIPELRRSYLKTNLGSKKLAEMVPYNDCLYRNLNSYDYVAILDIDEVIMPINATSWRELMDVVVRKSSTDDATAPSPYSSYVFRNVYFWDDNGVSNLEDWEPDIPMYMHMLRHVYRSANYTGPSSYVKSIHDVQKVLTVHNHFPLACLGPTKDCRYYTVDVETAHMQHYRADCHAELEKTCRRDYKMLLVKDTSIWRFADELIFRMDQTLYDFDFLLFDKDDA